MINERKIAVVIPCYNEETQIVRVITTLPDYVDFIICIDDASTDKTCEQIRLLAEKDARISVIALPTNLGVGGAIDCGYGAALLAGADLVGVLAGDGQMDPEELIQLIEAMLVNGADYSKITRLYDPNYFKTIPRVRLIGNSILSMLTRISSGYWQMSDSQTGYTVISRNALSDIQGNLWKGYGFPNDVLNKLGLLDYKIVEIPSKPVYNVGEVSKLNPSKVAWPIFKILARGIRKRITVQYIKRTLHPIGMGYILATVGLLIGTISIISIFIFQFLIQRNTQPVVTLTSFFIFQTSFILLWFSMIFDAMLNKEKYVFHRKRSAGN